MRARRVPHCNDALPNARSVDAFADGVDFAGDFISKDRRKFGSVGIEPLARHEFGDIEPNARTAMRTSPGFGRGLGVSRISQVPRLTSQRAFIICVLYEAVRFHDLGAIAMG